MNDDVWVLTYVDEETKQELVSHGTNARTFEGVVLPCVTPRELGAVWDPAARMYRLRLWSKPPTPTGEKK